MSKMDDCTTFIREGDAKQPVRLVGWALCCFFLVCSVGCLPFQKKDNPFQLKSKQSLLLGPQKWRIHYREMGRKGDPSIVFIHGYGSASVVWIPLMRRLVKAGYHCLALDLPGFGLSDKRKGNYETQYIARVVKKFMDAKGVQKADVVAHSWGSSVTLALAVQFPKRVRRIVINSGWVYHAQIVPAIRWSKIPVFGEILYGLFYREMPGQKLEHAVYDAHKWVTHPIVKQVSRSYARPGALAAALAVARGMNFRKMEARYHTIQQPTLLQWGHQDRIALPFYGRRLDAHLPNSQLVFLNRCGHMPMMERPYAFIRNIARFLGPARLVKNEG